MNTRTIQQINVTTDHFLSDSEDRQAVKLYLYQSIMHLTKSEASAKLGITNFRSRYLTGIHLKHFKESAEYRRKLNEIERECASDNMIVTVRNFRKIQDNVVQRSVYFDKLFFARGLDGRFCELQNDIRQNYKSLKKSDLRLDRNINRETLNALNKINTMNINKDKETVELWKPQIGKSVKVWGSRYEDVKRDTLGTYLAKHVDISMHYILLNGEETPRLFHSFEFEWAY